MGRIMQIPNVNRCVYCHSVPCECYGDMTNEDRELLSSKWKSLGRTEEQLLLFIKALSKKLNIKKESNRMFHSVNDYINTIILLKEGRK